MGGGEKKELLQYFYYNHIEIIHIILYFSLQPTNILFLITPLPEEIHLISLIDCDLSLCKKHWSPTYDGALHWVSWWSAKYNIVNFQALKDMVLYRVESPFNNWIRTACGILPSEQDLCLKHVLFIISGIVLCQW